MKTLLLALAVVAFVCPDSVNPLTCPQCDASSAAKCLLPMECPAGENICYFLWKYEGTLITDWVRGCASECPIPKAGETVECCKKNECIVKCSEAE
ncbi:toxin 3FTx-Lei1-like [Ahaetulla prasina]|uniref:toxin 3FTx-Lei1-like n=1 Tax=Ahaetulla prasina TaxID=499056 RepID=UPI00264818E6|nr:toxin 3FTx-Lei1-like [Ahaetulla prasina]